MGLGGRKSVFRVFLTKILASLCSCAGWFDHHFVGNPEDRFCHVEANIILTIICIKVRHVDD